jgi:signal transduction histidine kinase
VAATLSPQKVLVVDDDEGLGLLMVDALREANIPAIAVSSGKQALKEIARQPPDLLLLDLGLADVTGASVLAQLRDRGHDIPFIVVTGQGDERVAVEMMKQGALDYVIKDTGMLGRLPRVVESVWEKLASQRALAHAQNALIESEKRMLAVSEGERQRIGADLHDNLGQQLTAIELLCQSLREDLGGHPKLESRMAKICHFLQESVAQTRQLARGLTPVSLNSEGLVDSLSEMTRRVSSSRVRCDFVCEDRVELRDNNVATHLFRIAQEGLNNALKHSGASTVIVSLTQRAETLTLKVEDDGEGLPASFPAKAGIGLEIMRHRANIIGATLETHSQPGQGVTLTCTLPLAP